MNVEKYAVIVNFNLSAQYRVQWQFIMTLLRAVYIQEIGLQAII
jgi:hypothetical protein